MFDGVVVAAGAASPVPTPHAASTATAPVATAATAAARIHRFIAQPIWLYIDCTSAPSGVASSAVPPYVIRREVTAYT